MTPNQRLNKIKYIIEAQDPDASDYIWMYKRLKQLTEALESIADYFHPDSIKPEYWKFKELKDATLAAYVQIARDVLEGNPE